MVENGGTKGKEGLILRRQNLRQMHIEISEGSRKDGTRDV